MRLLDRYLLRELLLPLAFCVSGFLIVWVAGDVLTRLEDFQAQKMTALDLVEWYLVSLPEFLVQILPISLLLALLFALTAHARHHELTAIRAAGISLWRLAVPYFGVGLLASLAVLALNELWIPDVARRTEAIEQRHLAGTDIAARRILKDFGFSCSPEGVPRTWLVGTYDTATGDMTKVQLDWARRDGTRRWLAAEAARFTNGVWNFFNAVEFREHPAQNVNLAPVLRTNVLALPELSETPEEIRSAVKISQRLAVRSKTRGVELPVTELLDYLRLHPNPQAAERSWLFTKLHGRLATPWTCLVVVVIALPFGAASGRRNIFVGVAGSIGLCFLYFVLQQFGLALGIGGYLPPWLGGWFPNLIFAGVGAWLTTRVR
jgi:lipopolysaccharide export system permease protein